MKKTGLEVFDFNEEDELPEFASAKALSKFKNPNNHLDQVTGVPPNVEPVDLVGSERGCVRDGVVACGDLEMVGEDIVAKQGSSDLGGACQLNLPSHGQDTCALADNIEPSNSFPGGDLAASCHEPLSPGSHLFNHEQFDVKHDVSENMNDSQCCMQSPVPETLQTDVSSSSHGSRNCSSNLEKDGINITVDYAVYGDNYICGCLVTFSCSGIKIKGQTSDGYKPSFNFERGIEDIVCIESRHLQRFQTVMVKLRALSQDAGESDFPSTASGIEEMDFVVVEPDWSKKWEEIASLNLRYMALWSSLDDTDAPIERDADLPQQKHYFPEFDETCEEVVYPNGDTDAVSISKRDFELLQPETFINDTIIDFYIKYLKNQIPPEERNKFHFFNSFFFRKLADLDKDPSSASDGRAAFQRVRKWTRKVDIFGKDYIFIPVNFNLHWTLLVICHPGEVATFKEDNIEKAARVPCILHMDSIKGTHDGLKTLIQSYLLEELKERQKDMSEDLSSKFLNLRFISLELPQQENTFDCGLFLLHYLELFLADTPSNFSPFKINGFSKFLTVDWFTPAEASLKRTLIQRLISELLEARSPEASTDHSSDDVQPSFSEKNEKATNGFVSFMSQGTLPNSEACQEMDLTLLEGSSSRNSQGVNEPGFGGLFEPGAIAGSLLSHCSSFNESLFYRTNCDVSNMQDDVETGEQFGYTTPGETAFQLMTSVTHPDGSVQKPPRVFESNGLWNPGTDKQGDDEDGSSSEPSSCGSDDSDAGFIEKGPVEINAGLSQQFTSVEQVEYLEEVIAHASNEMLKASAAEVANDFEKMHDGCENGDLTPSCEIFTVALNGDPDKKLANEKHQAWGIADVTADDLHALGDETEREIDEELRAKRLRLTPPGEGDLNGSL